MHFALEHVNSSQILRKDFLRTTAATLAIGAASTSTSCAEPSTEGIVNVSVSNEKAGRLPPRFAGLSYEKSKLWTTFFSENNKDLVGLFRRLGPSTLRIGGNSVDTTIWKRDGEQAKPGQVSTSSVIALRQFLEATDWQVIYGINLARNYPAAAADEADAVYKILGDKLNSFEVGNECDLYAHNGLRPRPYSIQDFIAEWSAYAGAIKETVPNAVLCGPGSAGNFDNWTVPFAVAKSSQISTLTQHYYRGSGNAQTSTMNVLLDAPISLPRVLQRISSVASSNHVSGGYRLTEANSFFGGGMPGVSDAYGSALWVVDFLLLNALNKCAGINLHGGGNVDVNPSYTPIVDTSTGITDVRPIFYGIHMVSQISPGPMLAVNMSERSDFTAYAIAGRDNKLYVAMVNRDATQPTAVSLSVPRNILQATAITLSGHALTDSVGTMIGGSMISKDGSWTPLVEHPTLRSSTSLNLSIAPASATLVTLK
jgi:hypothetical protein